jgi:hypothetical protein
MRTDVWTPLQKRRFPLALRYKISSSSACHTFPEVVADLSRHIRRTAELPDSAW